MKTIRVDKGRYILLHEGEVYSLAKKHSKRWYVRHIPWKIPASDIYNRPPATFRAISLEEAKTVAEEHYLERVMRGISR